MTRVEAELFPFPDFEFPVPETMPDCLRYRDAVVARLRGYRPLMLDVDVPRRDGPAPVVVWLHGGAWAFGTNKHVAGPFSTERIRDAVVAAGFAFAAVQYRLSSEAAWPAQLHDVKSAVRWLRHHASALGIDPGRVAAWGESAGGHLAALLATTGDHSELEGALGVAHGTSRVQAAVDWYGPADLVAMAESGAEPALALLGDRPDLAREASPLHHAGAGSAPLLVIHGADDSVVPAVHSEQLAAAYADSGVSVELVVVPEAGHAFAGIDPDPYIESSVEYLRRVLA